MFLALPSILAVGLITGGASPASARIGFANQWDAQFSGHYPNAWGGGPQVNSYAGNTPNNDFANTIAGGGFFWLEQAGNVITLGDQCIGDYGNSQTSARAGLNNCDGAVPWGTNFTEISCSVGGHFGFEFKNSHWNGYLGPSGSANGSAYYLNKPVPTCFVEEPAA